MADFNYDPFAPQEPPAQPPQPEGKKSKQNTQSVSTALPASFNPYVEDIKAQTAEATVDVASRMARNYAQEHIPKGFTKIFKLEFYQTFFQCQTSDIMRHVWQSLLICRGNFIQEVVDGPTDLWYPIWITITLIFALFFGLIIDNIFNITNNAPALTKNSIPFIVMSSLIGGYQGIVPLIFWGACKCAGFVELRYTAISCLYGYSYTILVPLCPFVKFFQLANGAPGTPTEKLGTILVGSLFALAGLWAMIFFLVQLIKYLKKIDVGKRGLLLLSLVFGIVHCGFFIAIICIYILGKF